jgi:hypothetical protein
VLVPEITKPAMRLLVPLRSARDERSTRRLAADVEEMGDEELPGGAIRIVRYDTMDPLPLATVSVTV